MTDRDWMPPNIINFSGENWTHQSWAEDTDINNLIRLSLGAEQRFQVNDRTSLGLSASFALKQANWTTRGGDYVYSDNNAIGFRTNHDTLDPGPTIQIEYFSGLGLLGADVTTNLGPARLTAGLSGGFTTPQYFRDDHFLRDFYSSQWIAPAPVLGANVRADWALSEALSAYVTARYEKTFTAHGTRRDYSISTDRLLDVFEDATGVDLAEFSISLGLTGALDPVAGDTLPGLPATSGTSGNLSWAADLGTIGLYGFEFVAPGTGTNMRAQATNWRSVAPLFTLSGRADLGEGWRLTASGSAALSAPATRWRQSIDGAVWTQGFNGRDFGNVTLNSDTDSGAKLLGFTAAELGLGREIADWGWTRLSLDASLGLEHMKWESTRRPAGAAALNGKISYELTTPKLMMGLGLASSWGGWDLDLRAATGVALGVTGKRIDSFNDSRIDVKLEPQPVASVETSAETALFGTLRGFARAGLEARFLARGSETDYDMAGTRIRSSDGGAGGVMVKAALAAGLKGSF